MTITLRFSNLLSKIRSLFIGHYNALFVHLDAVQWRDPPEEGKAEVKRSQFNGQFLFAGLLFFWCFFDGNFLLEYEYTGLLPLLSANLSYYTSTPYIMFHQVTPPSMWWQTDNVLFSDMIAVTAAFFTLAFNANFPPRYIFYVVDDGANVILEGKSMLRCVTCILKYP